MSLLGVDVGTTGCKAAAYTTAGACLAIAYREYPVLHPRPGEAELDSRAVLARVWEVIAEVAHRTGADPITALAISSMGEAMTPVSNDREVLGTSILSSDDRGAEYIAELTERISLEDFYRINPNLLATNYSLPKLLWLREHEPETYARADKFLLWGDLVAFRLGGDAVTSYSLANRTLLFDIGREDWSEELLALSGVARDKLPRTMASGSIVGAVGDAAAAQLGLPKNVAVVLGGHDQCCNCLGAGIHEAHKAVCGIGTFECITTVFDHLPDREAMRQQGLSIEHHVLAGLFVSFVYNQAGSLVRWFRDTFAAAEKEQVRDGEDIYDRLAGEMPGGPTNLIVLPYFETTGPPQLVADATGLIAGLRMGTTRGEILKAIMEGATFYFADSVEALGRMGLDTSEFVATGGGAKSDQWLQIQADIFGRPFVRPRITECSVLGAAMLAGMATGVFDGVGEAVARFVKRDRVFEPDPSRHARYREKLEDYRQLFPRVRGMLGRL